MTEIFVSYRIADSVYAVREISNRLADRLGRTSVFRDQDSLALGSFYPRRIRQALEECDVMVVVIGPRWLDACDKLGRRRIDDEKDWVRLEIRTAFEHRKQVVPVLLDGTSLPAPEELPADIRGLAYVQVAEIRHQSFESDVARLIENLVPAVAAAPVDPT
ncbi:toll/interleukin-1 receptor domain-containing protein, partial [Nocardia aurea]|uniref:toll/interleukin-1 receptor domain-containing protein n=1 Tax=Nocardia aurea TaxID=2144174 RepID=UPI0033B6EBE9